MAGDMRVQLQALLDDKEKQLNLAGTLGQRILAQQLELEERINQLVDAEERLQASPGEADTDMRNKLQELADVMQAWETENERLFGSFGTKVGNGTAVMPPSPEMPPMNEFGMRSDEASTSMRSSGPSAAQSSRRAKNAAHRANDVEFAFEIGSSLLVEVRRLQALLAERDKMIQDMKEEKDDLEKAVESLRMSLREQEGHADKFREENWNLEVQLQEVRHALSDSQATSTRLESEQKRMTKQLSSAREASDAHKNEMERLATTLEELRAKHETDVATMRKNAAGLQRDKSDLQATLDALKADIAKRERAQVRFGSPMTPSVVPETPGEGDDMFSTGGASGRRFLDASATWSLGRPDGEALRDFADESPEASPSKPPVVGPSHPSNELESTKQSLAHAHRQIATLKSAVQREKELNRDMKKRLTDQLRSSSMGESWEDEDADESIDVLLDEPGHGSLPRLTPARMRGRGRGRGAAPRGGSRVSSLAQRFGLLSGGAPHRKPYAPDETDDSLTSIGDHSEMVPQEDLTSPFNDSIMSSRPPSVDGMDPAFANVLRNAHTRGEAFDSPATRRSEPGHDSIRSGSSFGARRSRGGAPMRQVSRPSSIVNAAGALAGELGAENLGGEHGVSTSASLQQDLGLVSPMTSPTRSVHSIRPQQIVDEEIDVDVRELGTQTEPTEPVVVIKEVPVEVIKEVQVEVIKEVPVEVEVIREVEIIKEVPVEVIKEVEVVREVQVPFEVIKEVPVEIIREVEVIKEVPVPTEVIREVVKEVPVEVVREVVKEVIKEVPVEVIKEVEVVREVQVLKEMPVDVVKEVQVERVKEVPVEVVREVEVIREVPKEIIKEVVVEVVREVEVVKEVEVIKEVPVEVIKEVPIEIVKEVEVIKEVPVTVYKEREPEPKPETAECSTQTDEPAPVPVRSTSDSGTQSQPTTSEMGVGAEAAALNNVSTQTRAALTADTEVQADDELHTPIAVAVPSPMINGDNLLTPPRSQLVAMMEAMDLTPTPNAIRAGAQQGLVAVGGLQSRDSLFQQDEDARTITAAETPTEGEWTDARESIPPTPSGLSEFHSATSGADFGFQSESDRESIVAGRVGTIGGHVLQPTRDFETKSVDAVPPSPLKPELRERAIQTDPPAPATPVGFQRLGTQSQFKYIPSSPGQPEPSPVAMGKRPMPVPRESFDTLSRARADRRQSIESAMSDASSMRSVASPKPKPVGPVVQVDRTRPPTMMLPPPPPMPPPPMPSVPSIIKRTQSNIAPPRPTSPPPPELLQRATTPTFGGPSSLLVPQRTYGGGSRQTPPSPASGIRQPPSTSSMRTAPKAAAQGASMSSGPSRRPSISSSRGSSEQHRTRFAPAPDTRQPGTTDPTVIHAITQTMIGEFLFKYTRKVVGKGHGEKRHKRFFWVHPYTKTLYWSDADPGANGVLESSAKSAYIDSVRAVLDPNPVPPGIHQYSIVVSTPQREMKFTAPTKERHDIWLSALSYLLARPSTVSLAPESSNQSNFNTMPSGPADENRQQILSSPRSVRTTGSTSYGDGWNSNTTPKAFRTQSQVSSGSAGKRHGTPAAEYMRWNAPPEAQSPTKSTRGYQPQMIGDDLDVSYENIDPDQYEDGFIPIDGPGFEGLENVRACCDGAHDLGSLSRHPGQRHHHHHHNRPPSRAQDIERPMSPRERPLSPAFSFRSRASSKSHGDGGSMFSWGGDGEKKYSLRFGSKRSKSKRPTSPIPSEHRS